MDKQGIIFNLQRFSTNDGPGIRTTVFLKGCPLNCLWCHNPESKTVRPEVMFNDSRCVGCGNCVQVCPHKGHTFTEQGHQINRKDCTGCGTCVRECPGALELMGKQMTAEQVLREVLKDRPFYEQSGGGLTVSGGEPFAQPHFLLELLKEAKEEGLHVCVETCGYTKKEHLLEAVPYVDLFLYDWKESDPQRHRAYTGVDNDRILENLQALNEIGAHIILRCPIIPGYNDRSDHFTKIAALAEQFTAITRIDIEPYHPLGREKSRQLGKEYPLQELGFPEEIQIQSWIDAIRMKTDCPVKRA